MRVAEISNPVSFHTEQWAKQLIERGVEPYVIYVKDWEGKSIVRTPEYNCEQFLLNKPKRTKLITSMIRKGRFRTLIRGMMNKTSLHSQLEFYGPIIRKFLSDNQIDVVHGHYLTEGVLLAHAAKFKPAVIASWGSDLIRGPQKYPYLRPLVKRAIEWADVVHTESEISANIIREIHPIDDDHLFISSWGVDTDFFVREIDAEDFRQKHGIGNQPVIIQFRPLELFYRPEIIIRAFALVLKEIPDAILIVGNDGSQRQQLIKLCKDLGISDNVIFTGYIYEEEMAKAYAVSDVYIQCPTNDGVSISGMQAMSVGIPIVANDVGETRAFVQDGVSGFFVEEPDNPKSYAEKIILLLTDDDLRKKMGTKSREIALRKHNRKLFLDKYIAIFERLKEQYQ
ncbi:MAG: glycosyltransferase family 4 protein [Candidatus Thorarchaeota archaeon]|nr:glycosyltransferase family 4 protein [Candidatus Thorarchaeota archaeon]